MMRPEQDARWDIEAGSLPLSSATERRPQWRKHSRGDRRDSRCSPTALDSARVRPVHAAYPQISQALGEAIVSVLLGRDSPPRRCAGAPPRPTRHCSSRADPLTDPDRSRIRSLDLC